MISFLVVVFVLACIIKFFSFRVFKIIIIVGIIFIILNFIISHFNDFINRCRSDYDENINVYSISDKYDLKSKGNKKDQILSYNFNYADNNLTKFGSGQRCKNANYVTDNLSISCPFDKFNENLFKKDKATIYHYRAGLFGSGYFGDKDGEFFQIFPVTALKNDDKTTEKQSFLITDKNSSEKIKINLNTYYDKYGGDKILLRGFAEKNSQHIICYDAVYSAKTPGVIQMVLYYQKGKKLFKKDIKFKKAGVKNASID